MIEAIKGQRRGAVNVILIIIDTLRKDHLGAYGNKWIKTPNLDSLARESAIFTRAANESLPTLPQRRSLLTGIRTFPYRKSYYDEGHTLDLRRLDLRNAPQAALAQGGYFLGVQGTLIAGWEPIPSDQITLAEILLLHGYDTCLITDTGPYMTWPMNFHRGFRHWDFIRGHEGDQYGWPSLGQRLLDVEKHLPPAMRGTWEHRLLERMTSITSKWKGEEDYWAAQVWTRASEWLENNRFSKQPFFMMVDCFDPHEPFLVPKEYADLYDADYEGLEPVTPHYGPIDYLTERQLQRMRALYAADVTFVDKWFGLFLEKARSLGLLENTLICLTSDHGFQLGEHGVTGKIPAAMWKELHDVPLFIRHPQGLGAGQQFDALVQGQDIFATILSFLGVPPPYPIDGKHLWPIIRGETHKVRDYITCGYSLNVRAVDDEYSFISLITGEEPQLCDLRNDPEEKVNIAKDKPHIVKRMYEYVMEDAGHQPILPGWRRDWNSPVWKWVFWTPFAEEERAPL